MGWGASNPLTYNTQLNIYGCLRSSDEGYYFYKDGSAGEDFACYYSSDGDKYIGCGEECNAACTSCNIVHHDACLFANCKIGDSVDPDGDGQNNCRCYGIKNNGVITNGHCCLEGHVYVNGVCQKITCPTGQCLSDTFCVNIDSASGMTKAASGLCVCEFDDDCYDSGSKKCLLTDTTRRKNALGQCEPVQEEES
ncbi:MAG: hypothetical protein IJV07_04620 [Alphaproteobacteria bacterium]|nr:hypothetical protein [Alphaproteobacteria bacterium]